MVLSDMPDSWVTNCPHCSTAFKLNPQLWLQASGQVRCGSCLQVFTASRGQSELDTKVNRHKSVLEVPATEALQRNQGRSLDQSNKQQLFDAMQDAPVLLDDQLPTLTRWRGVWASGLLIALLALPLQYLWFNQQMLAYQPPFDKAYDVLCLWVSCHLPQRQEVSAISVESLTVRQHPDAQDAIIVDMLLLNGASFEQPFPLLELIFSDDYGEVVRQRRLAPPQYLGGELAGVALMPVAVSVRLSLEFVDPGSAAKAYQVELYSALEP